MKHASFSFARPGWTIPLGVAIVAGGLAMSASAQQPSGAAMPDLPMAGTTTVAPPVAKASSAATPAIPAAPASVAATATSVAKTLPAPATTVPGAAPSTTAMASPPGSPASKTAVAPAGATAAGAVAGSPSITTATPEDTNPFSNVKPVDNQALKAELPAIEQKLQQMQNQMSAIQSVQVALPADALNAPGHRAAGPAGAGAAPIDEQSMELQASTFVACVNGQAMFRDTDQKPFFVDAKEANQNEAVRRIGGCKH